MIKVNERAIALQMQRAGGSDSLSRSSGKTIEGDADARKTPLNHSVYDRIKQLILGNRLRPGQKLAHQDLADRLQVSRTPVCQALERLYQEGYVIRIPDRGYFVVEINSREARDLYQVRLALEPYALGVSMSQRINAAQFAKLKKLHESYRQRVLDDSVFDRVLADQDFHIYLATLSGNQYLVNTLNSVFERLNLKRRIDGYWAGGIARGKAGLREHDQLLRAIRAGHAAEAQEILTEHIQAAWVEFEAHMLKISVS